MSLNNQTIHLFSISPRRVPEKCEHVWPPRPRWAAPPLESFAGRLASLSKQLGPPIGPSGPQLPPCPPAPSLSMVGQSHPKPVVANVEYQRSLNSLASSIHSTPSTPALQTAGSQHQISTSRTPVPSTFLEPQQPQQRGGIDSNQLGPPPLQPTPAQVFAHWE